MKKKIKELKEIIITINYEVSKKGVICYNSATARYIWGSKIGITDLRWHMKKIKDGWLITWDKLEKRKNVLTTRLENTKNSLGIIEEVLKSGRKKRKT